MSKSPKLDESKVRMVFRNPKDNETISITPIDLMHSGVPICPETGDDLEYSYMYLLED